MTTVSYTPYTNIGPLTTVFTAPSSCESLSVQIVSSVTYIENYRFDWPSVAACYPSGYPLEYNNQDYYSPGICPSGWGGQTYPGYYETTILCCPSSWILEGSHCTWKVVGPTSTTALVIHGELTTGNAYGDNTAGLSTSTAFVMPSATAVMEAIEVRYRAGDFGGAPTVAPSTGPDGPTATPSVDVSSTNTTKIAIGIVVPLIVLILLISLISSLIRKQRRGERLSNGIGAEDPPIEYEEHKPVLSGKISSERRDAEYAREREADALSLAQLLRYDARITTERLDQVRSHPTTITRIARKPVPQSGPRAPVGHDMEIRQVGGSNAAPNTTSLEDCPPPYPGPLQAASEDLPAGVDQEEFERELRYREERLIQRRELLAERERIAREEDELMELRARTRAAGASTPAPGTGT